MTSSDRQSPEDSRGTPPTTREIPVVQPAAGATATQQLPPHPKATTPASVEPVVPTGPVDLVPGLPGAGTPPPPPVRPARVADTPPPLPSAASPGAAPDPPPGRVWPDTLESGGAGGDPPRRRRFRASGLRVRRDRAILPGVGLAGLSLVLLGLGLTMHEGDGRSYWDGIPLWSAFASVCALVASGAYVVSAVAGKGSRSAALWRIAAAGLVGLAAFWLLVVLPVVATDRGFVLTAALAALGGALWVGPRGED